MNYRVEDKGGDVNADFVVRLASLSTPHLADACLRVGASVRCAPAGVTAVQRGMRCAGRALPVRHVGSVDIFLEVLAHARPGDVLVVDNGGRLDEACVGDLVTLEVQKAGLQGIVIWGLHRDTDELLGIGLPEEKLQEIMVAATNIRETERKQAEKMHTGVSLREQTRFAEYLSSRALNPSLGFREHLRRLGGAIEE
jgi:4-hydroxy-4-methyl-2-oxoglutarate aldolase